MVAKKGSVFRHLKNRSLKSCFSELRCSCEEQVCVKRKGMSEILSPLRLVFIRISSRLFIAMSFREETGASRRLENSYLLQKEVL